MSDVYKPWDLLTEALNDFLARLSLEAFHLEVKHYRDSRIFVMGITILIKYTARKINYMLLSLAFQGKQPLQIWLSLCLKKKTHQGHLGPCSEF